jgi:hypothetical protein
VLTVEEHGAVAVVRLDHGKANVLDCTAAARPDEHPRP